MKTIIVSLLLLIALYSCSDDTRYDERNPKSLITVDFSSGVVKESGNTLLPADKEIALICLKVKEGLPLPDGYTSNILCVGGDGKATNFIYVELVNTSNIGTYLITYNDTSTLAHHAKCYNQADCLNRWIISN